MVVMAAVYPALDSPELRDSVRGMPATTSADRAANTARMRELVAELQQLRAAATAGGGERATARHRAQGKLTVRERLALLVDPDSAVLELGLLAAHDVYADDVPGAGIVTAVVRICGRACMVVANDATVKGGTYYPLSVAKHLRAQQVAAQNRLPCVYLVDSGGAHLPLQAELFADRDHGGRFFHNQARMSAAGIPQIACVMGSCTAGGAYVPAMCDESVIVAGTGTVFLAGPPLLKAAVGEVVSAEELGGADVHTRISGVCDHRANDDAHALELVRSIVEQIPARAPDRGTAPDALTHGGEGEADLDELVDAATGCVSDVGGVITRIVDAGELAEFKARYGAGITCGFARVHGMSVGVVANEPAGLDAPAAAKAAHFVELCTQRRLPVICLENGPGADTDTSQPDQLTLRARARLLQTVAAATVPRFVVVLGGSCGPDQPVLCPRTFDPNQRWIWPAARVSVEGPGGEEREAGAIHSSARLWDDGVIEPAQTRDVLALGLAAALGAPLPASRYGVLRM
jgi:3-methylcrotonyl-CoA carboxylase beta subunit